VLISRRRGEVPIGLDDVNALTKALRGCDAIAHLAGINREIGTQTYQSVHVIGTANVIAAARTAGAKRIVMLSFLRARPNCASAYHESKWAAEELLRNSNLPYAIVKSGVIYGRGDHLLDHISHALFTAPLFATVGFRQPPLRPVAVEDVAKILAAAVTTDRLNNQTIAVVGPEILTMPQVVRRIAAAIGRRVFIFPMPVWFHRMLGAIAEVMMRVPLISRAQVRMLAEGLTEPAPPCPSPSADLLPITRFDIESIRRGLPEAGRFSCRDLRCNLGGNE
jgi:uncharacterized protein YbjT (DUF2867 family)